MLLKEKLERAKVILAKTDLTVREVAHQLGFNSGWREFSEAYKAYFHTSPTAHRTEIRQGLWGNALKPKSFSVKAHFESWKEHAIHREVGADEFDQVDLIVVESVSITVNKKKHTLHRDVFDANVFYKDIGEHSYRVMISTNVQAESLRAKTLLDGKVCSIKVGVDCTLVANVTKRRATDMPLTLLQDLHQGDLFFQSDRRDGLVFRVTGVGEERLYLKCLNRNWEGCMDYSGRVLSTEKDDDGLGIRYFDHTVTRPTGIVKFPAAQTA